MRLIDADTLRADMYHEAFETDSDRQKWDSGCWIRYKMFEDKIESVPTIDAVPVVRCKDCKWFAYSRPYSETPVLMMNLVCFKWGRGCRTDPDGFCFMGERKE